MKQNMELTLTIAFFAFIIIALLVLLDAKKTQEKAKNKEILQNHRRFVEGKQAQDRSDKLLLEFFQQNNICRYKIFILREYKYDGKPYGKPLYAVYDRLRNWTSNVYSTDEELKEQYGVEQIYISKDYKCIER